MATNLILACWIGFYAFWLLSAGAVKPTRERQPLARELRHRLLLWAAIALLLVPVRAFGLGHRTLPHTALLQALAAALTVLGLAGAVWARRTLGGNWSIAVTLKEDHELVQRGPYRWVRNPIYTSLLLMFAGTALAISLVRGWVAVALAFLSFSIKLRHEEALLQRQFPAAFADYRRRVKALIPFLF